MPPLQSLMAPRSRGSRKAQGPKTPEPFAEAAPQPPAPSRPRFRLRRRNASQLNAPTQQFLASVDAADVPMPSIEEPRLLDEDMLDTVDPFPRFNPYDFRFPDYSNERPRGRTLAAPKTPAPRTVPSLSPKRFPDWSLDQAYSSFESSSECESSRPSTAQSTQTSASLFSRYSLNSDDFSQYSPDTEEADGFASLQSAEDKFKTIKVPPVNATLRKRSRRAPWTRPMTHHLWSTYLTYLQDPHVTPFRIGKTGIPPHGVCMRVAREAKRSWKGSKPPAKAENKNKSGSTTPTVDAPASYVQWPHSCAATRAQLRELCKANTATAARNNPYLVHSSTSFGRTASRFRNRRSAPLRSPSVFGGNDMALSLAVSTCESMQPNGPLTQLTSSQPEPTAEKNMPAVAAVAAETIFSASRGGVSEPDIPRLGSPFMARSYGPSSSTSLAPGFGVSLESQRQSHTVGTRRRSLGSPARLSSSRPNMQKRRSRQSMLEPRRYKRPSLGSDLWTDPFANIDGLSQDAPLIAVGPSASNQRDPLVGPRTNLQELIETSRPCGSRETEAASNGTQRTLAQTPPPRPPLPAEVPRRLGSPFSATTTSFSFPNRRSSSISAIDFGAIRRPFATVQRPADANAMPTKSSLRSRLAFIDERLKDFRRRSQSPL